MCGESDMEEVASLRLIWRGERDEEKKKIAHMIGWENSSELWDPSVSCNEFINPSNNDLNELLKEKNNTLA